MEDEHVWVFVGVPRFEIALPRRRFRENNPLLSNIEGDGRREIGSPP